MAQMMPQTRHYTDRTIIFEENEEHFSWFEDFTKQHKTASWKSMDAEFFSKKWYLPGTLFRAAPYQLKDAFALGKFVFGSMLEQPQSIG